MIDFILSIFSGIFQINMRDVHEVPFAMPLMMGAILGLTVGFYIVSLIGNEEQARQIKRAEADD